MDPFLMREVASVLTEQTQALSIAMQQIAEWQELALNCCRSSRDLAIAWRVALEQPETDLRDDLDDLVRELSDHVARLEEQIVP